ncbi:MAG: FkbM family methyltransferase, partial [Anaerolineales bacterium]
MSDRRPQRMLQDWIDTTLGSRTIRALGGSLNATFKFPRPITIKVGGSNLFAQTLDRLAALVIIKLGVWERDQRRFVRQVVKPGDVSVDVGANVGQYTAELSSLVGSKGKVYAFEPAPANFRLLKMAVEANNCSNTVIGELAVLDRSRRTELYLSEMHQGDHRIYQTDDNRPQLRVEATSLDEFLGSDSKVDFVKIDVQGAEPLVLRGMRRLI